MSSFDIVVIGGGHAGSEAALAAARLGCRTLLVTLRKDRIASMPCNPSVGGIAKSHLVVELDALGGEMGRNADFTALQYRMLNTRRGPAVQATRLQCDKPAYAKRMKSVMEATPNLTILEDEVIALRLKDGRATGVWTAQNGEIEAKAVVLTAGTFLRGTIHIGHETVSGGGNGQPAANALADQLRSAGLSVARLKTGTPPRLDPTSLHYERMLRQDGDEPPPMFSWTAAKMFHVEHAEDAEVAAQGISHAEFAEGAEAPALQISHAESAEAMARGIPHAENAETLSPPPSERGVARSAGGSIPCGAKASVGHPSYPCHPCETIAPNASAAVSVSSVSSVCDSGVEPSAAASAGSMFHVEHRPLRNRRPCYLTHTTEESHRVVSEHLKDSALYGGDIVGTGARYCPSFEDKVVKFASRTSHHVFVEPESDDPALDLAYPNGLSCSLSREVQIALVHSVPGLEDAIFRAWAYAIEYDFYDPRDLRPTLESRRIPSAFFAGQVNGTTGYEEAAAQGFMAGVNAAALVLRRDPLVFDRAQAYIGVLIDDLVTKGTDEPYRMFTSRAERRLLLRQDNARYRLLDAAERLGIAPRAQLDETRAFASLIDAERERIFTERWQGRTLDVHLCREGIQYADLPGANPELPAEVIEQVVLAARYRGYLEREEALTRKMREQERVRIPDWIDYSAITVMRYESREKLQRVRPANLGQAARIPGVNPADIALLSVVIHRGPTSPARP